MKFNGFNVALKKQDVMKYCRVRRYSPPDSDLEMIRYPCILETQLDSCENPFIVTHGEKYARAMLDALIKAKKKMEAAYDDS